MRGWRAANNAIGASCDTLLPRKFYAQNHHARRQLDGAAALDRHGPTGIGRPPRYRGSRPRLNAGHTEEGAARAWRFGDRPRCDFADAHSSGPRGRVRRVGEGESEARSLRSQTGRAAYDRSLEAAGERGAAVAG